MVALPFPTWSWLAFFGLVLVLLFLDLFVFHRNAKRLPFVEAVWFSPPSYRPLRATRRGSPPDLGEVFREASVPLRSRREEDRSSGCSQRPGIA
jgi:hypothetical protein